MIEVSTNIPRMLTIKETAKEFNLPEHFVRQTVLSGRCVAVRAGKKYLVNANKFSEFLNTSTVEQNENIVQQAGIMKVPVKM